MKHLFALAAVLCLAAGSGAVSQAASPSGTIHAATTAPWVVRGSALTITGTVRPHPAGTRVVLQRKQGLVWSVVRTGAVAATGTFSFVDRPTSVGLAIYRVVTPTGATVPAVSANVPVRVLHWTYLSAIYARPVAGDLTTDPIVSNGVAYANPVVLDAGCYNAWNGDSWVFYSLGRKYERLTATLGLDDLSQVGSSATYTVIGDGKTLATGALAPGATAKLDVSLSGVARMRLLINVPDPTGAAGCGNHFTQVVFGNATVLGP
jgi:hypothetical protein